MMVVFVLVLAVAIILTGCGGQKKDTTVVEVKPIILGVPTALGTIEGADSLRAVELAVKEINANGGVTVGGEKRPLKIESIDTRESEPGLPVHDALAAIERLITDKKPHALVVSSFRSEVLLSSMDLIGQYKVPNIITIAMTTEFEKKLQTDYDKYKYNFRMGLTSGYLVQYLSNIMEHIGDELGFKKVYIINQDVLWAEGTAGGVAKWFEANGWEVVGKDSYPTGASDFSSSLTKARQGGAQVIMPVFDMPQAGILLKQAKSMRVPALMAGFISPAASA
ncbi:MAG: ABC transporter substrate-binding protein, partial [Clostridia bacterium]|nr:ABC transporter substrate-binding protein [Clostridia bacterium]